MGMVVGAKDCGVMGGFVGGVGSVGGGGRVASGVVRGGGDGTVE